MPPVRVAERLREQRLDVRPDELIARGTEENLCLSIHQQDAPGVVDEEDRIRRSVDDPTDEIIIDHGCGAYDGSLPTVRKS